MLCRWCRHDGNGYSGLHSNYRSEYYEYLRHGLRSESLNNPVLEVWILRFRAGNMYCFLSVRISSLSLCPTAPFRIWILAVWYVHRFLFQIWKKYLFHWIIPPITICLRIQYPFLDKEGMSRFMLSVIKIYWNVWWLRKMLNT